MSLNDLTCTKHKLTTIFCQSKVSYYSKGFSNNSKNKKMALKLINEPGDKNFKNTDLLKNENCNSINNNYIQCCSQDLKV